MTTEFLNHNLQQSCDLETTKKIIALLPKSINKREFFQIVGTVQIATQSKNDALQAVKQKLSTFKQKIAS